MNRLASLKARTGELALGAIDLAGLFAFGSGAAFVAFLGKLMLAVVLGAFALGCFLRLARRQRGPVRSPPPVQSWIKPTAALLAAALSGVAVEAAHFPVRFDQPGFAPWHWVLVALLFWGFFRLMTRGLSAVASKGRAIATRPE